MSSNVQQTFGSQAECSPSQAITHRKGGSITHARKPWRISSPAFLSGKPSLPSAHSWLWFKTPLSCGSDSEVEVRSIIPSCWQRGRNTCLIPRVLIQKGPEGSRVGTCYNEKLIIKAHYFTEQMCQVSGRTWVFGIALVYLPVEQMFTGHPLCYTPWKQ